MDRAFGETAVAQIDGWRKSCVRWVSAYSTVFPEFASVAL